MPVCIAGMHRSGTSMVAKVLHGAGLFLGDEGELMPPLPENQDGFWEHLGFVDVNDKILESLGGWWDCPPALPEQWHTTAREAFATQIDALTRRFAGREPWGWKDPRNSLTLPLWRNVLPGVRTVICIRNPIEVALSLKRRNTFSYALSLRLWWIYNRRVMDAAPPAERIVTHYDAYFEDPVAEAHRVLALAGLPTTPEAVSAAASATARDLRHNRMTTQHLIDAGAPAEVIDLYLQMCTEAGWLRDSTPPARPVPRATLENAAKVADAEVGSPPSPRPVVLGAARLDRLGAMRVKVAQLEQELDTLRRDASAAAETKQRLAEALAELEETKARLALTDARQQPLRDMLLDAQARILHHEDELNAAVATALRKGRRPPAVPLSPYEQLLARLTKALKPIVPANAVVAAVSKGDEGILRVAGGKGVHFPQDSAGAYAGYNPTDSADAIRRLEVLRAQGVSFVLFPSTAFWWLDHYAEFRTHLEHVGDRVLANGDCIVYRLGTQRPARMPGSRKGMAARSATRARKD